MQNPSVKAQPQRAKHRTLRNGHSSISLATVAALMLLAPTLVTCTTANSSISASNVTVLENDVPRTLVDPDTASVELGATFTTSQAGTVTAIRFYKSRENIGPHVVKLWSAQGEVLATATLPTSQAAAMGWQNVTLTQPVKIAKDQEYVASYVAPNGGYSSEAHGLDQAKSHGPLTILAGGGVYVYGDGGSLPISSYQNSNYFVDVDFSPETITESTSPVPGPTRPTTPPPGSLPLGVSLRSVDGGADYYQKFAAPLPSGADYFPVGVWYESVVEPSDTVQDKAAGINTYVELTSNSNISQIQQAGMNAVTTWNAPAQSGSLMPDEVDMWAGPGNAPWTGHWPGQGEICEPAGAQCGYTIQSAQKAAAAKGSMIFSNYGKGVTFWESTSQATQFVNDYPDVISDDNYWFTDPNICGISEGGTLVTPQRQLTEDECRKASNYGWTVEKIRSLVSPKASKPVWAFVEVGHPFTDNEAPTITGPQIRAAVWSSLIHGARGLIYFNHNFGGPCLSQHVLRDACGAQVLPDVTALNTQIKSLAPVLNAPFLDGAATSNGSVDTSVQAYQGNLYVFAGSTKNASQQIALSVKCSNATSASVLGENRAIPVKNGVFSDSFADGNAVHLYQFNGSNTCGL